MRIDRLEIENFKKFAKQGFALHPQFTLLAGENGSGKTTILDALSVAAGIWLVEAPDSTLSNSGRNILASEIRLEPERKGDRVHFRERRPVVVRATGRIGDQESMTWSRQVRQEGRRTSNGEAKDVLAKIKSIYRLDENGEEVLCPVLAYYGAGRAWLPSNRRVPKPRSNGPARRWAAFYDCFSERIRFAELQRWFQNEAIERGNRAGRWRPGFEVVSWAVLRCVPGADGIWFDTDREQLVLSVAGNPQPFDNLSAGQRMMLALVADLAIKAVTQNNHLVSPEGLETDSGTVPRVLRATPGVVLIDELDVHLHPRWQRRAATDLKTTFPGIQFVCTSHSPQVIGEVRPEEVRQIDPAGQISTPARSFGIDSSRVLEEVMRASPRNESVEQRLREIFRLIDQEKFDGARNLLSRVEAELGPEDPEITRARALMAFLESGE